MLRRSSSLGRDTNLQFSESERILKALSSRELAALLTFREFLRLCAFFDARKQTKNESVVCASAKFDVYAVMRDEGKLIVNCRGEDGELINLDCAPARQEKAA